MLRQVEQTYVRIVEDTVILKRCITCIFSVRNQVILLYINRSLWTLVLVMVEYLESKLAFMFNYSAFLIKV